MRKELLCACTILVSAVRVGAIAPAGCDGTAAYSPCEMYFDVPSPTADPYATATIQAEFRGPNYKTYLMPGFWDGKRMVIRFAPTQPGKWVYRLTSSVSPYEGKQGSFNVAASDAAGFLIPANIHHWAALNEQVVIDPRKPHLWIGDVADRLPLLSDSEFESKLQNTIRNKFTHLRVNLLGNAEEASQAFPQGRPDPNFFDRLDRRLLEVNTRGIVTDLVLASNPDVLRRLFPDWQSRNRFIRYLVARYSALNMTWQGVLEWEDFAGGRELLKSIGEDIKKTDPYSHPRSTNAKVTSSPLMPDGWMNFIITRNTQPGDEEIGSIEHELYAVPFVAVTTAARLWSATASGEYPVFQGTELFEAKNWYDFVADTRHWEMEPYFDVDGGRAIALDGVEYILYVDKPGPPVEVLIDKHKYDVSWFNPLSGESMPVKDFKGEHFTGTPPDTAHPWILDIARESHKASMLHSWRFESREVIMQQIDHTGTAAPYEIKEPVQDTLPLNVPVPYTVKLKKQTRATRTMMYLWTAEVAGAPEGFRVLATGDKGSFEMPKLFASTPGLPVDVRVTAMNANGKVYVVDKLYQLGQ